MKYRIIGNKDLEVSEIGLGTWPLSGKLSINEHPFSYGDVSKKIAYSVLEKAYENGINIFDSADIYGLGKSEYYISEVFKDVKDIIVITKAGYIPDGIYGTITDISYNHILASVNRSLNRLKRSFIDIFLIHVPPVTLNQWYDAKKAIQYLKKNGLIKFSGISVGASFNSLTNILPDPDVQIVEAHYNLLFRDIEKKLLADLNKYKIGLIVASPLSRGILSEKSYHKRIFDKSDVRNRWKNNNSQFLKLLNNSELIKEFCRKYKISISGLALSYLLKNDSVKSIVPGIKSVDYLTKNIEEVYDFRYSKEIFNMLDELLHKIETTND